MGEIIWQIREKIDDLKQALFERGLISDQSDKAFADHCLLSQSSLSESVVNNNWSQKAIRKVAEACQFSSLSVYWIDPLCPSLRKESFFKPGIKYEGRDVALNFRSYYRGLHGLDSFRLNTSSPTLVEMVVPSFSVQGNSQQRSNGEPIEVHLSMEIEGYRNNGHIYGFNSLKLNMNCASGDTILSTKKIGSPKREKLKDQSVEVFIHERGTNRDPVWLLTCESGYLSDYISVFDPPLCQIEDYSDGDSYTISLQANVLDGKLIPDPEKEQNLGGNKEIMIEALIAESLCKKNHNGWISLAKHRLEIIQVSVFS